MENEIAKATGKLAEMVSAVTRFADRIVGAPLEQVGLYLGDTLAFYRYRHLLKIRDKVEEIHRQRGLHGEVLPIAFRNAIPLLDKASLEDDDLLQDMWATLIANATDPTKRFNLKKIHIDVLASFEPLDARVLSNIATTPEGIGITRGAPSLRTIVKDLGVSDSEVMLSLQNVARLGCITDIPRKGFNTMKHLASGLQIDDPHTVYRLTPLGHTIVELAAARRAPDRCP